MPARRLTVPLAAVALLATGCVQETRDGDTTVVAFEPWVGLLIVVPGLMGVMAGLVVLRWQRLVGALVAGLSLLGTVALGPNLFCDRVTVNPERFTLQTGFWFYPTDHEVRFAGLSEIAITAEERAGRHGDTVSYYLVCRGRNGAQKVPVGDLIREGGWKVIRAEAERQGVPIVDRTGGR